MKNPRRIFCLLVVLVVLSSCANQAENPFKVEEVSPWCIIGFDSMERTPEQRIELVKQMGFTRYGFNRGNGDLSSMKEEFSLAKENNIVIPSIFLWLNANRDSIGSLSPTNQELLGNLKEVAQKPIIWLSFSPNFFDYRSQEESIQYSIKMIEFVQSKAYEVGCKLALYNHHGWFGNPHNQVDILEQLKHDSITMVFNFYHAQKYVDEFPAIAKKIQPYLSFVNLSGVKKEGPQIVSLGEGDYEFEMVQQLLNEGYNGPWGILGHVKTEDVQQVLERNIKGLQLLHSKYRNEQLK